jgi:hypothetical protein
LPDSHAAGAYAAPKEVVLARLRRLGASEGDLRFRFVDGYFEETLLPHLQREIPDLVFVNIDVDIHRSTLAVLDFIEPLLRPGVVLYWDDWKNPFDRPGGAAWGEHLAWQEWSDRHPEIGVETIAENWVWQRTMIVTRTASGSLSEAQISAARTAIRGLTSLRGKAERILLDNRITRSLGRWLYQRSRRTEPG